MDRTKQDQGVRRTATALRPARLTDVPSLLTMMAPFNRSEGIPWRPKRVQGALRRLLRDSRLGRVIVAEGRATGALVGYVVATLSFDLEFAGPDAFVTELFVTPENRGRGLGRRLVKAMATRMRADGAGALHLLVWPENKAARRLYERVGFEVVPRLVMTRSFMSGKATSR